MCEQEFVKVAIRIKPENEKDNPCFRVISKDPSVLIVPDRQQTFHFDDVFTEDVGQETIYNKTVKPLVESVIKGFNCTVFAYGQTGTGKTYTVGTHPQVSDDASLGLIPRTLNDFLRRPLVGEDLSIELSVSFLEIYNEKVYDLLQPSSNPLLVQGFKVKGFNQEKVSDLSAARQLMECGNKNRHTAETRQNEESSRSHAIFTIYCNVKHRETETLAKLNLVDLAGSESVKKTGNQGSKFHEGININKGLLAISRVITALSTNSNYIPYRQSIITSILQDSLNKQTYLYLIACISPLSSNYAETSQTLDFAQRVKGVKNKPIVNEVIANYRRMHPFARISATPMKRSGAFQTPMTPKYPHIPERILEHCPEPLSGISAMGHLDDLQKAFSPVVRRYMNTMEEKMGVMIQESVRRRSSRISKNVQNMPNFTWDELQSTISKTIKEELRKLQRQSNRAASTPLSDEMDQVKKVLTFNDSPTLNDTEAFKVPEVPKKRIKSPTLPVRRSKRLSVRDCNFNDTLNVSSICDIPRGSPKKPKVQLAGKENKLPIARVINSTLNIDSPRTIRTKHVLNLLNNGTARELETLQTIGVKTAHQIILARNIDGNFKKISEVGQRLKWTTKRVSNFVNNNFVNM